MMVFKVFDVWLGLRITSRSRGRTKTLRKTTSVDPPAPKMSVGPPRRFIFPNPPNASRSFQDFLGGLFNQHQKQKTLSSSSIVYMSNLCIITCKKPTSFEPAMTDTNEIPIHSCVEPTNLLHLSIVGSYYREFANGSRRCRRHHCSVCAMCGLLLFRPSDVPWTAVVLRMPKCWCQ
jgi:hypothetical protein